MKAHGRVWLSKCAAVAILLLMLMWPLGAAQGNMKVLASQTSPAVVTNAARCSSRILSASPSAPDSQARKTAAENSPAPKAQLPKLIVPRSPSVLTLQLGPHDLWNHMLETSVVNSEIDSAELWKEVGNGSTSAEVALASLYFDGVVVSYNCPQARAFIGSVEKGK